MRIDPSKDPPSVKRSVRPVYTDSPPTRSTIGTIYGNDRTLTIFRRQIYILATRLDTNSIHQSCTAKPLKVVYIVYTTDKYIDKSAVDWAVEACDNDEIT